MTTCTKCPVGKYSNKAGEACKDCPPGTAQAQVGSSVCAPCPRSTYNSMQQMGVCIPCPAGRITPTEGSERESQCLSPGSNFLTAIGIIPFVVWIGWDYLYNQRFHKVAFLRQHRVIRNVVAMTKGMAPYIFRHSYRAEALRVYVTGYRRLRVFIFFFVSSIMMSTAFLLGMISAMLKIVFKSLIVVAGLRLNVPFIPRVHSLVGQLASMLKLPDFMLIIFASHRSVMA